MDKQHEVELQREERAIYLIVLAACAPILIALGIERRPIDGGNTLVLILVSLGLGGLIAGVAGMRRRRMPHARALRSPPPLITPSSRATGSPHRPR